MNTRLKSFVVRLQTGLLMFGFLMGDSLRAEETPQKEAPPEQIEKNVQAPKPAKLTGLEKVLADLEARIAVQEKRIKDLDKPGNEAIVARLKQQVKQQKDVVERLKEQEKQRRLRTAQVPAAPLKPKPPIRRAPDLRAAQPAPRVIPNRIQRPVAPRVQAQARVQIQGGIAGVQQEPFFIEGPNIVVGGVHNGALQLNAGLIELDKFVLEDEFLEREELIPVKATAAEAEKKKEEDLLRLLNADKVHGSLIGVDPDKGLAWKSPSIVDPVHFKLDHLALVKLADQKPEGAAEHKSIVHLTNDDSFKGDIVELNEHGLVLDTWYAGQLYIRRIMLKSIQPNSGTTRIVYEGPTDASEWQIAGNSWRVAGKKLIVQNNGTIGRQFDNLPDKIELAFNANWRGYVALTIQLFGADPLASGGTQYSLNLRSSQASMYRYENGKQTMLWNNSITQMRRDASTGKTVGDFKFYLDLKDNQFLLEINGKEVKRWTDPNATLKNGGCISFNGQQYGNCEISDIRVTQWNGKLPDSNGTATEVKDDQDLLYLINTDVVPCTLKSIKNDKAMIDSDGVELAIPLARVNDILFASETAERARRMGGDVKAQFTDWGQITLDLQQLKDGSFVGRSQNFAATMADAGKPMEEIKFADVKLPVRAFKQLDFNIYDAREEDDEELEELFEKR